MSSRRVAPPSGMAAPAHARLYGERVALTPLAEAIADRYFAEFPEDLEAYGEAGRLWEIYDTSHVLQWAFLDVEELCDFGREIAWLTDVLKARGFPLNHLFRNLVISADVVLEQLGQRAAPVAERLRAAG
jgi:hypothetical protein